MPVDQPLSSTKLNEIDAFLLDPADKSNAALLQGNGASSTIIGILKDMYDTMTRDLEAATEQEATSQKNFEALIAEKEEQLATAQEILAKTEEKKAEAEKNLADNGQELEDTTLQMKEDTKFFDEMKAACAAKAKEWE